MQLQVFVLVAFVLGVNFCLSRAQSRGCPPAEDIAPCVCYIPPFYLVCENIHDVDALQRVAENLEGAPAWFGKLIISNSSLQYLPTKLLEIVKVKELHIENVTIQAVFREPPATLEMFEIIRFHNVRLLRGVVWTVFSQMKNLKILQIDGLPVPILGKDFSENVPRTLQELDFRNTKTRKFETGVFENFKDLKKLYMWNCRLEEIHRNSFPVPFNIEIMFIIKNSLKSIPDDLFTNMPHLDDIILVDNQISTVPESAFGGRFNEVERFYLKGNPLKCDCALRWIVIHKPKWFDGTCASPKVMHGRELNNLYWESFIC